MRIFVFFDWRFSSSCDNLSVLGVSGILNDRVFVVELGVTVVLEPRRLPLRNIRSVDSCIDGRLTTDGSRIELIFDFVERTSGLYLKRQIISMFFVLSNENLPGRSPILFSCI